MDRHYDVDTHLTSNFHLKQSDNKVDGAACTPIKCLGTLALKGPSYKAQIIQQTGNFTPPRLAYTKLMQKSNALCALVEYVRSLLTSSTPMMDWGWRN